jgi:7-keto-8-aminopelargonate synthetase-like enzyme
VGVKRQETGRVEKMITTLKEVEKCINVSYVMSFGFVTNISINVHVVKEKRIIFAKARNVIIILHVALEIVRSIYAEMGN